MIRRRGLKSAETRHLRGQDLTGHTFGKLFVVSLTESPMKGVFWLCACSCGNVTTVRRNDLSCRPYQKSEVVVVTTRLMVSAMGYTAPGSIVFGLA